MSTQEFHTLQRYAMKMAKDPDDRDELVLLAWQESIRLGAKASMPLLVNFMKFRARENTRSIVGVHDGGKSLLDVWHHDPVSLNALLGTNKKTLMDVVSSYERDPFGQCVVIGFEDALSDDEQKVAEQMVWGYSEKESALNLDVSIATLKMTKSRVRQKAIEHLV